jgi:hypothetical protein
VLEIRIENAAGAGVEVAGTGVAARVAVGATGASTGAEVIAGAGENAAAHHPKRLLTLKRLRMPSP